jgi:hypothetical protein
MSKNQDLGELINGIKSLGTNQLNAPAYTSATSFTGTLAGLLGFDSSGNIITTSAAGGGVTSFNTRTGAVTLSSSDVTGALGYTPVTQARTLTINGTTFDLSADRSWTVSGSSQWTTSGSNIYFTGGFVGINTTSPQYILDVSGGARFTAWSSMGINARFAWNMISDQYLANGFAGAIRVDNADGRFSFYTAPSGVAGAFPSQTERFTITNLGSVGIGTTSIPYKLTVLSTPSGAGFDGLVVTTGSADVVGLYRTGSSYGYGMVGANQSWIYSGFGDLNILADAASANIKFGTNGGVERMRINSAGNVIINSLGTSAPNSGQLVNKQRSDSTTPYLNGIVNMARDNSSYLGIYYDGSAHIISASYYTGGDGGAYKPMAFYLNDTEFMRMTYGSSSVPTLVIGSTVSSRAAAGLSIKGRFVSISSMALYDSGSTHHEFVLPNGQIVGQITTNSSNTTYSTSSDYRLKYDCQDLKALDLIHNLKIYQYKWKVDNAIGYGVMAHELQEYLPYAVTGKKDGEEMQAVDYSKLAPIAIAGVKQLNKLFESHAEKIARLESEVAFLKSNIA